MDQKTLLAMSEKYAEAAGYILNPDKIEVAMVLRGLLDNEKRHGFRLCPCRTYTEDMQKDKIYICPCRPHRDDIKRYGCCKCRLFFDKNFT
jgi:ferredoxin-thioredoxin reductase catalytic chain